MRVRRRPVRRRPVVSQWVQRARVVPGEALARVPAAALAAPAAVCDAAPVEAPTEACACGCFAHAGGPCRSRWCGCSYYWPAVLGARTRALFDGAESYSAVWG